MMMLESVVMLEHVSYPLHPPLTSTRVYLDSWPNSYLPDLWPEHAHGSTEVPSFVWLVLW